MDPIDPADEREWEISKAFKKKDKVIAVLRADLAAANARASEAATPRLDLIRTEEMKMEGWTSIKVSELDVLRAEKTERQLCAARVDVVFDGPPSHESGRFVEVENSEGMSINFGDWVHRPDGYWVLRFDAALTSSSPIKENPDASKDW